MKSILRIGSLLQFCGAVAGFGGSGGAVTVQATLPQLCFGGGTRTVEVRFANRSGETVQLLIHGALFQQTSASVAKLREFAWTKLELLPGQTIITAAPVALPEVTAESRFLIQWLTPSNQLVGVSELILYPTNLLVELRTLAGREPLGVLDPQDELKPLLRSLGVEFQDLAEDGMDRFHGKLAVLGPFATREQMRETLVGDLRALAKRGVAVVWLQPPPGEDARLKPSFYTVRLGAGAVVVAKGEMVSRLAESPEAQLNLLRLAEAALRPEPLDLPESEIPN